MIERRATRYSSWDICVRTDRLCRATEKGHAPFNRGAAAGRFAPRWGERDIPAGTVEKWEVTGDGRALAVERVGGRPRRIDYLPYPANYGFVPRTLSAPEGGGDGDPLDGVLLGPAAPCGAGLRAQYPGVFEILETWFVRYEGPGNRSRGVLGAEEAWAAVSEAARAYADSASSPGR
jgi:hypothetical protein